VIDCTGSRAPLYASRAAGDRHAHADGDEAELRDLSTTEDKAILTARLGWL